MGLIYVYNNLQLTEADCILKKNHKPVNVQVCDPLEAKTLFVKGAEQQRLHSDCLPAVNGFYTR